MQTESAKLHQDIPAGDINIPRQLHQTAEWEMLQQSDQECPVSDQQQNLRCGV